jgi:hypothetical protein
VPSTPLMDSHRRPGARGRSPPSWPHKDCSRPGYVSDRYTSPAIGFTPSLPGNTVAASAR